MSTSRSWYRSARALAEDGPPGHLATVTPETAGWAYSGLRRPRPRGRAGEHRARPRRGRRRPAVRARRHGDGRRHRAPARRPRRRVRRRERLALRAARLAADPRRGRRRGRRLHRAGAAASTRSGTPPADDVPVTVRGAGAATRQVTDIATPDSFAGADRIMVCEVVTPGGNVVLLAAAPARRARRLPDGQRGDLLLPDRPARRPARPPRRPRALPRLHRRRRPRRDGDDPGRRRVPRPAGLPRAVRGAAGVPDVLPQRPRRPRARSAR